VLSLRSESLSFSLSLLLPVFLRASSPLKRCRCLRNALAKKEESSHKQIRCLKCENPILREREKKNCLGFVPLLGFKRGLSLLSFSSSPLFLFVCCWCLTPLHLLLCVTLREASLVVFAFVCVVGVVITPARYNKKKERKDYSRDTKWCSWTTTNS